MHVVAATKLTQIQGFTAALEKVATCSGIKRNLARALSHSRENSFLASNQAEIQATPLPEPDYMLHRLPLLKTSALAVAALLRNVLVVAATTAADL